MSRMIGTGSPDHTLIRLNSMLLSCNHCWVEALRVDLPSLSNNGGI